MIYCSVKYCCSNSSIPGVILHSNMKSIKTPNHPAHHWSTLWPLEVWVHGLYNSWWFCVHKLSMFIYLSMVNPLINAFFVVVTRYTIIKVCGGGQQSIFSNYQNQGRGAGDTLKNSLSLLCFPLNFKTFLLLGVNCKCRNHYKSNFFVWT